MRAWEGLWVETLLILLAGLFSTRLLLQFGVMKEITSELKGTVESSPFYRWRNRGPGQLPWLITKQEMNPDCVLVRRVDTGLLDHDYGLLLRRVWYHDALSCDMQATWLSGCRAFRICLLHVYISVFVNRDDVSGYWKRGLVSSFPLKINGWL